MDENKAIRPEPGIRDILARERTILANERTLLAYVRTTIMLVVSSVSLIKLFPDNNTARWAAIALAPVALVVALVGLARYCRLSAAMADLKETGNSDTP